MKFAIGATIVLAASFASAPVFAQTDCEAARCALQSAIADPQTGCPCDGQTNHGQYVSCVAHKVRDLARQDPSIKTCKGKITRCAAKSTCGKENFITCTTPVSTCNTTTGTCANDDTVACTVDADCGTKCHTKRAEPGTEATVCAAPGVVGTGSCCASCD
jgi:hypothetical protein